ncbi:DsbA family protein [Haliangium sp.]|uniref:DsbA family protein n=1 Tax=Haliangium sp. TaxID=2663208 RepID=UPI003D0A8FDE
MSGRATAGISTMLLLLVATPARAEPPHPRPEITTVSHRPLDRHPTRGQRLAPVTMDFFFNPGDRSSAQIRRHLDALQARHPRRLRVVYRVVAAERDHALAVATMEAHAQGRFDDFLDQVLAARVPPRREHQILAVYEALGLDPIPLRAAWSDGRHDSVLERNEGERKRRTDKAPSLLVNGDNIGRAASISFDKLETLYREALEEARAALAHGVPAEHLYTQLLHEHALERAAQIPREYAGAIDGLSAAEVRALAPVPRLLPLAPGLTGHDLGPVDAPVQIHFFCNFLSSNCVMLKSALASVRQEFGDQIRLVFHHLFPHPVAVAGEDPEQTGSEAEPEPGRAASSDEDRLELARELIAIHRAALCADEQGRFWDFYRLAYQSPLRHRRRSADERVRALLTKLPVAPARFQACLERPGGDDEVLARVRAARAAGVDHTPALVIGGRLHLGFKSSLELRALVEEVLTPGLLERRLPTAGSPDDGFERGRVRDIGQ